jgi:hypothetical protein
MEALIKPTPEFLLQDEETHVVVMVAVVASMDSRPPTRLLLSTQAW